MAQFLSIRSMRVNQTSFVLHPLEYFATEYLSNISDLYISTTVERKGISQWTKVNNKKNIYRKSNVNTFAWLRLFYKSQGAHDLT